MIPTRRLGPRLRVSCLAMLALMGLAPASGATGRQSEPAAQCDRAAEIAAREHGVPVSVLKAIALAETGRRRDGQLRPWPWTVNMEGAGHWFGSAAEAQVFLDAHLQGGARNFDVGCFQINYRWHGQAFASVDAMLDPLANARYAAGFMKRLFAETGDWSTAAGTYHSRTPQHSARYRARFDRLHAGLQDAPAEHLADIATGRVIAARKPEAPAPRNGFPLLQSASAPGRMGSLFPRDDLRVPNRLIAVAKVTR